MSNIEWGNYSDFYRGSGYGTFPQEHRRPGGRLAFRMILVEQGPHDFVDPAFAETILALPLEVQNDCNWGWTIGEHRHRQKAEAGRMLVVPAEIESRWNVDGSRKILVLAVPNDTVRSVLGPACPRQIGTAFWKLCQHTWADPFIEVLMNRLWESAAGHEVAHDYLADGLLTSILSQLLIRAGTDLQPDTAIALPQWRLKRVKEFVDNNLGKEIGLEHLADAAGLSRRHFARSFYQELGKTPHRWLMQERLEKAKELLAGSNVSICEIAENCGFSSQSHFTTALKQSTGMTPHRWRQHFRR
ncbi:helix-turn-helix domain-containing protein [Mesorhizobium sp. PUT5]|uniref:helix-turn-helix domain-containing protein n=1 Tax=Mesorhizobium sp. PUT5 TaxID=3454629 RepID=UPI003FA46865